MTVKIQISGTIKLETGMHIGGVSEFSAIGAVDSSVVRDALRNEPIIPGSSLKGKLRYLLAEKYNEKNTSKVDHNDDAACIKRLFGASSDSNNNPIKSRLYFSDSFLSNKKELKEKGLDSPFEVKAENSIDRFTAVANPRFIERVVRGSSFNLSIIYNMEEIEEVEADLKLLLEGLKLLELDYLGANGSRGYGRVSIQDLDIYQLTGEETYDFKELGEKLLGTWEA